MNPVYFAFGSNMSAAQMRKRCPRACAEASAVLLRYRLAFGGASRRWGGGVATLVREPRGHVEGILYRLPRAELLALDRFEGAPHVYRRVRVYVRDALGRRRRAWTYTMDPIGIEATPSVDYLLVLLGAYVKHGFDRGPLLRAAYAGAA